MERNGNNEVVRERWKKVGNGRRKISAKEEEKEDEEDVKIEKEGRGQIRVKGRQRG